VTVGAFTHEGHPARVVFGAGVRARAAEELERMRAKRALLVVSPRLLGDARARLGAHVAAVIEDAVMHVPVEVARRACEKASEAAADSVVAFGGGSAIGLAKAVAKETGLPILALATTYAGSEMTSIWGLTQEGKKQTGRDPRVRPKTVLYDPELLLTLAQPSAAASGLNAVAHAMEALYAKEVSPVTQLFAKESVAKLARHLPRSGTKPELSRATESLYGAWLAGVCLEQARMGLHHKICHVLGGSFGLAHADTHAVILPYVAAYNRDAAPLAMAQLAYALETEDAPAALFLLARHLGVPSSLAALGMQEKDVDAAASLVLENPYPNPRPVDLASIRQLLRDAFRGDQGHLERSHR
jgi:maleylacetate reductase